MIPGFLLKEVWKEVKQMKVITRKEAAALIKDGMTVAVGGFGSHCVPDELLLGIEERYREEKHPHGITIISGICTGNNLFDDIGHNRLCEEGLLGTVIAAHFKNGAALDRLISDNKAAGYALPLGVIMDLLRASAAKAPGIVTRVGLRTYVDPRIEGPAVNQKAKEQNRKIVSILNLDGRDYLFYRSFNVDACVIRGTCADEDGNISFDHEDIQEAQYHMAVAAHNNGGIVIVQVEKIVSRGTIPARSVKLNHVLVDYVVVSEPENHKQNYGTGAYLPELSGQCRIPVSAIKPMPLNVRKVIARRAVMELKPNSVINLGIGMPSGVGNVANEEGITGMTLSLESGPLGGVPLEGIGFGSSINAESITQCVDTFDFYDGGGLDSTFLGIAEIDENGDVNVSRFGKSTAGPGGFINITQSTSQVFFIGNFTAGKSEMEIRDGRLKIIRDGGHIKFVKKVQQITFSADYARETGQRVLYITERAVFQLADRGIKLIEKAPGVDLQRDILDKMEFKPLLADEIKEMDSRIFEEQRMGLNG